MRGSSQLEQASGTMPTRPKMKPKRAWSEASRMSIDSSIVAPMPTAGPLTAAITGFLQPMMASATRPPESRTPSAAAGSAWQMSMSASVGSLSWAKPKGLAPSLPRSMPAQKPLPSPVTMTTRTASSSLARPKASISSSAICSVKAFSICGRFSVSHRMPLSWSRRMVS